MTDGDEISKLDGLSGANDMHMLMAVMDSEKFSNVQSPSS